MLGWGREGLCLVSVSVAQPVRRGGESGADALVTTGGPRRVFAAATGGSASGSSAQLLLLTCSVKDGLVIVWVSERAE